MSPAGEALGAGPGDHRRIVGAQPGGRDAEAAALALGEFGERGADGLVGGDAAGDDQRRRSRLPSASRVRSTRQSITACWKLAAMSRRDNRRRRRRAAPRSSGRRRRNAARPNRPAAAAAARRSASPAFAAPRPPGHRDSRGRAAWPPCRSLAGGIVDGGREAAVAADALARGAAGNGRRRRAAADRESRDPIGQPRADSAWPSRWLTAMSGLPAASASPLAVITRRSPRRSGPGRRWRQWRRLRRGPARFRHRRPPARQDLEMGASGDFRDDPAIGPVRRQLPDARVGEDLPVARHHRRGSFVAHVSRPRIRLIALPLQSGDPPKHKPPVP